MQILFVTNDYPCPEKPGASPCIEQQKNALEGLGFKVDVLFFDGPQSRWNYFKALIQVFSKVQLRKQYDLVHAHYGFSGLVARAQMRCPVVVTFRGSDVMTSRERPISRIVAASVDEIIVMSDEMRKRLGRDDAHIIPYGIDIEQFKPCSQAVARQQLGLATEDPIILFPYDPRRSEKRFDIVEKAVTILKREFPSTRLLTIFNHPHHQIANFMNACDVMVLASDTEGAPVAVREAMACNLPIVSVDVGDVAQVIRGTEGCAICPRTPDGMADQLAQVLRERKRSNGRMTVSEYSLSRSANEVAQIYQKLLPKQSPVLDSSWSEE